MNTEDVSPHLRDGFPPQKMIFPCGAATTGRLSAAEMIYCTFKPSHLLFASATHTKRFFFSHPVMVYGATFVGADIEAYTSRFLQLGTRTSTSISSLGPNIQLGRYTD